VTYRPRGIVLHTVGVRGESTVEAIRDYHVRHNGWRDIGYHFLVHRDGSRSLGRTQTTAGAHTSGANDSLGVACTGDGDSQPWTFRQWRGVLGLLTELCLRYGWSADDVCGHREAPARLRAAPTSKTCPGRLVDCDEVRAELAAALAAAREGA
jgi:N-acetyl-anhydromuramyl-L-alanine amidase AmpD